MTDMKKNIKRTAVLSVVLVLMFAITVFGAEQTEEYVPAVYATFWARPIFIACCNILSLTVV